ncbi:MAG: stage II sporulation protein M [Candidatus ainarchaeum sp.]|jgi:uncharacterized membrane protein SpoIIM required for sporulation|nr:stage II sporulation protein M [Candidatus ainarchaeum sp.]
MADKKSDLNTISFINQKTIKKKAAIPKIKKKFSIINYFKENKPILLKNLKYFFLASFGVLFSLLLSVLIFPENIGLFTIILTTLFLMPQIYKQSKYSQLLFGRSKKIEHKGISMVEMSVPKKTNFLRFNQLYNENKDLVDLFLIFFLGIFLTIMLFILIAPFEVSSNAFSTIGWDNNLVPSKDIGFDNQDKLIIFKEIFVNNLSVIFVCFLFALIFPSAGILIVVWNAILWGVIFTQYMSLYSLVYNVSFSVVFLAVFWSAIPHIFLEAIGYFFSTIAGIILAISIKTDFHDTDRLFLILKYSIVLLGFAIFFALAGSFFEAYFYDIFKNLFL